MKLAHRRRLVVARASCRASRASSGSGSSRSSRIYFIALLGLNVLTGYSGQISLGHGAFMGVGAYSTAILTLGRPGLEVLGTHPPSWLPIGDGMTSTYTIPLAFVVAGIVGFAFGIPGAAARGRVARARDVRGRGLASVGGEAVRERDRRRRRAVAEPPDDAVRLGHLDPALALLPGLGHGGDPRARRVAPPPRPRRTRLAAIRDGEPAAVSAASARRCTRRSRSGSRRPTRASRGRSSRSRSPT